MDLSNLKTDAELSEGKHFAFGSAELLIAPRGRKYEAKLARLVAKYRKANRNKEPKGDAFRALNIEATVGTCLLGWKEGSFTNNGAAVPWDEATAIKLLANYSPIREFVFTTIQEESQGVPDEDEETEDADRPPNDGTTLPPDGERAPEAADADSAAAKSGDGVDAPVR